MNFTAQQKFDTLIDESHAKPNLSANQRTDFTSELTALKFKDPEAARQRAAVRRWKVTENLDRYLIEFEANFSKTGAKVLWARDVAEAHKVITEVLRKNFVKEVYTSEGGILNEIELTQNLHNEDIKITAIENTEALTSVMITEAGFFIADPGVVLLSNGKSRAFQKALNKCRCVIAVAGINDVLPNLGDLSLFLPLQSSGKPGEQSDTNLLFGPRKAEEGELSNELYFLIIDNGRSNLLAEKQMRPTAWCINCGACNAVCPVNAVIGTNEGVYEGPVKTVQMPLLKDFEEHQYLTRASTLCGACTQVCPVHINLHELFIHARHKALALQLTPQKEKWFYLLWKKTMLKRDKFNFGMIKSNRLVMETVYEKVWGIKENQPPFAKKSFNELWKERNA